MTQQKHSAKRSVRKTDSRRIPTNGFFSRLIIMLAVVAAIVFGVAIFFKVGEVEVQGNTLYSAQQIIEASGVQMGDNLLTVNKAEFAGRIMAKLPYIEKVSVGRNLPNTIVFSVQESTVTFAVTTDTNTVWLINAQGKAIERYHGETDVLQPASDEQTGDTPLNEAEEPAQTEQKKAPTERGTVKQAEEEKVQGVAQLVGVTIHNPTAGETVSAVNQSALDGALAVLQELSSTGILAHVSELNVEKEYNIVVSYDDQYEIELGPAENLAYKIRYLTAILEQLSEYQAGTIDLTFTEEDVARFHPKA